MRKKPEPVKINEVTIVPACNGFTIKVETEHFNSIKLVCKDFEEMINFLKTLNWNQTKVKSLGDLFKAPTEDE